MEGTTLESIGLPGFPPEPITLPKMNIESNNGQPRKDGFVLDSSNESTQRGLNSDYGAGANAASRAEMMFVTVNPLSELVWSPRKGLSLKSAECRFAERKPSLLWGGGSNMVLSLPQNTTSKEIINSGGGGGLGAGGNSISCQMASHFENSDDRVILEKSPRSTMNMGSVGEKASDGHTLGSGGMGVFNKIKEEPVLNTNQKLVDYSDQKVTPSIQTDTFKTKENTISSLPSNVCMPGPENEGIADVLSKENEYKPDLSQAEPACGYINNGASTDPFSTNRQVGNVNSGTADIAVALASEFSPMEQCKSPNTSIPNLITSYWKHKGVSSANDEDNKDNMNEAGSTNVSLEIRDLTDVLQPMKGESSRAEVDVALSSQPTEEVKHYTQQNEGTLLKEQSSSSQTSPNNSATCLYQRKDKIKALSIGVVKEGNSKEEDSYESVESCNGAGLSSVRKRSWSFKQKFLVGGKRMKKQIHENPSSSSFMRQDSSFVTWISNMIKGISRTDPDVPPSLALTVRSHHEYLGQDQCCMACDNHQSARYGNMGFQTTFQALCLPSKKIQETRTSDPHHSRENSKEEKQVEKINDNKFTSGYGEDDAKFGKEIIISGQNFNLETSRGREGTSNIADNSCMHAVVPQAKDKIGAAKTNTSCKIAHGSVKCGISSSTSSSHKDYDPPCEGEEACQLSLMGPDKSSASVSNRNRFLGSSWITRFSTKVSNPVSSSPSCEKISYMPIGDLSERTRVLSNPQDCIFTKDQNYEDVMEHSAKDQMDILSRNFQKSAVNTALSLDLKTATRHTDHKLKSKLNPILPSQRFKNSGDMASVFARRLYALRHIITSEVADNATCATTTCLFCGIRGHNLQDCSEMIESEIEDLMRNISSYVGAEESPCLCIRCFQLNHWAIACPYTSFKRGHLYDNTSLLNFRSEKIHHNSEDDTLIHGNDRNLKPSEDEDNQCRAGNRLTICDGQSSRLETKTLDHIDIKKNLSRKTMFKGWFLDSNPVQKFLGSNFCEGSKMQRVSKEFVLNGKKNTSKSPLSNFITRQVPEVPTGTFEAIRRLRISRTDILKGVTRQIIWEF
ncbi:PREDICTED: uncharacterized protein LOC104609531 isoform X2 [Nelumbo nucifera]|uniref:Uncharacterized protein LOC104609531 isoform X2 n=1 Tax=Nelumbo nucifera TaxID=4432 RepID=A0A1U8Q992_NELNU|nr:PREDICTED: uncharacterized protein LOC104609531 isoform X2 [Nelumbo nucifera]